MSINLIVIVTANLHTMHPGKMTFLCQKKKRALQVPVAVCNWSKGKASLGSFTKISRHRLESSRLGLVPLVFGRSRRL